MPDPAITVAYSREKLPGTFPGYLGVEFVELAEGRAVARMAIDERHLHPWGYVHGGVWGSFADTVAGWGTTRTLDPGVGYATGEYKTNIFTAGEAGDVVVATAQALHLGRRTQVWECRIAREGDRRAMAHYVCTQVLL